MAAILFWAGGGWFVIRLDISSLSMPSHWRESDDWGTPTYQHRLYFEIIEIFVLTFLAVLPNRWLVFSRIVFIVSLSVALIPIIDEMFHYLSTSNISWPDYLWLTVPMMFFTLLPLSLILSFARLRKGEKVFFA